MNKKFTILELLIVITIILILAALLLPMMHKAKTKTRDIECLNSIRQNIMGLTVFAKNNDNSFPDAVRMHSPQHVRYSVYEAFGFANLGVLWNENYIEPEIMFCAQNNAGDSYSNKRYQFYLNDGKFDPWTIFREKGIDAARQAYIFYPYQMDLNRRNDLKIQNIDNGEMLISDGIWENYHNQFDPMWGVGKIDGSAKFQVSQKNFEYTNLTDLEYLFWSKSNICRENILNEK